MARRHIEAPWASSGDTGTAPLLAAIQAGWSATEPPFQLFNWLQNLITEVLEHLEQNGIGDWDTNTSYAIGGLCIGTDRALYRAVIANQGENPVGDDGTNWLLLLPAASDSVSGLVELATDAEAQDGVDDTRAITAAALASVVATVGRRGLIEVATDAEVAALVDVARAVTPAGLGALVASTSQRGIAQLASQAEVQAGTNATKAVTPDALAGGSSIASSGYYRLPGGLILQWGRTTFASASTGITQPFPIAFPNNLFGVFEGGPVTFSGTAGFRATAGVTFDDSDLTQVTVGCGNVSGGDVTVCWMALGN